MPNLVICLVILISGLALTLAGVRWLERGAGRTSRPAVSQTSSAQPATPPIELAAERLTREQLDQRLRDLQRSQPAIKNERGAMCYKVARPPDHVQYVCPKCGARTQYPRERRQGYNAARDAASLRTLLKDIEQLDLSLDESELCERCSPGVAEPSLILVVKLPGSTQAHRRRGVTYQDVILIREFLAGETIHHGRRDEEKPLKDYLPRIRKLLGLEQPAE